MGNKRPEVGSYLFTDTVRTDSNITHDKPESASPALLAVCHLSSRGETPALRQSSNMRISPREQDKLLLHQARIPLLQTYH